MKNYLTAVVGILCASIASSVMAEQPAGEQGFKIGYILGAAASDGGDKLLRVTVEYEHGGDNSSNVEAGGLLYIYGGVLVNKTDSPFQGQFTLGYHFDGVFTEDDDVSFSRFPLDMILNWKHNNHLVGAGLTYHLSPELDAKDVGLGKIDFDDAMGTLIQYQYAFNSGAYWGIRYTFIDYEIDGIGEEIDGNHISLHIAGHF